MFRSIVDIFKSPGNGLHVNILKLGARRRLTLASVLSNPRPVVKTKRRETHTKK